ncbi:MAG: hypothetical protein EOO59_13030 [Hymenobacter sp.]|nr:MAG: hypothetical protein EOO59_13030 [Hymenobacter sp.]
MNTLSSSASHSLLERVRQRLQHNLAVPIRPQAAGPAETQVWQIGSAIRLLATPPAGSAGPPAGPAAADDCPTLLVYDYVPGQLGAQLRAQGICYADAAGNAWLRHPALLVSVQGCGRLPADEPTVASPAQHVQLLRLLFQLVVRPELAAYSVPNMAAHTQLPVAVVRQVVRSLAAQGLWNAGAPLGISPLRLPTPLSRSQPHQAGFFCV